MSARYRLHTCSYSEYRPGMGVGVRASLGTPRWIKRETPWPYVREIAPHGSYLNVPSLAEFYDRYLHQLETHGAARIGRRFAEIAAAHPGPEVVDLVLLCFEKLSKAGAECHRTFFARWWTEQTGEQVDELGAPPAQDALFDPGAAS
ncbi:MAG TPA: hypothetical protein VFV01_48005 [Spirillospora sp.]|nr:hypothetical protein [Spirillospora sp.]